MPEAKDVNFYQNIPDQNIPEINDPKEEEKAEFARRNMVYSVLNRWESFSKAKNAKTQEVELRSRIGSALRDARAQHNEHYLAALVREFIDAVNQMTTIDQSVKDALGNYLAEELSEYEQPETAA